MSSTLYNKVLFNFQQILLLIYKEQIKNWRASGWSLRKIAKVLTNQGTQTKQGGNGRLLLLAT
ncbi:MAG: hypothetical protein FD167_4312 [bacterium]|nr:MAG: hypothetical protein FD167_4312 [bacterium]